MHYCTLDGAHILYVILSVFLSLILFSSTVLQYIGSSRYSIETDKTVGPQLRELRETTSSTSESHNVDSAQLGAVTIESCLGVEEPAEENVR